MIWVWCCSGAILSKSEHEKHQQWQQVVAAAAAATSGTKSVHCLVYRCYRSSPKYFRLSDFMPHDTYQICFRIYLEASCCTRYIIPPWILPFEDSSEWSVTHPLSLRVVLLYSSSSSVRSHGATHTAVVNNGPGGVEGQTINNVRTCCCTRRREPKKEKNRRKVRIIVRVYSNNNGYRIIRQLTTHMELSYTHRKQAAYRYGSTAVGRVLV